MPRFFLPIAGKSGQNGPGAHDRRRRDGRNPDSAARRRSGAGGDAGDGGAGGSGWALAALLYLSVFTFLADSALRPEAAPEGAAERFDDILPVLLALAHFALLPLAVWLLARGDGGAWERVLIFAAFALFFGIMSTANAHELIHRPERWRRALGRWVFVSLLFGHHVSAHLAVHHRHVATPFDPNTARPNEGFWRFFARAWRGSLRAGLAVEKARLARRGLPPWHISNPYLGYGAGALAFLGLAAVLAGPAGVAAWVALAASAQLFLLLSDYVQHYGLQRRALPGGGFEPVGLRHSWNAPHVFSGALMMNAPRHSDHHARPDLPHGQLRLRRREGAPMLPRSLPVMSCIALLPGLWRRVMNPHLQAWRHAEEAARADSPPRPGQDPAMIRPGP